VLLSAERNSRINKSKSCIVRKKARSDKERTLASIYGKNSAAAKSKQAYICPKLKILQRHSEPSVLFSLPLSLSKVGKMLPILGSFKRQISKTGKLNRKRRSQKG
jgi:hypothetical protein